MAARTPPRNVEIKGQEHMLAYITPAEGELLKAHGGSGEPGPMGIPAFVGGDDKGAAEGSGTGDHSGGAGSASGANEGSDGMGHAPGTGTSIGNVGSILGTSTVGSGTPGGYGGGDAGEGPAFLMDAIRRPGYYWHMSQRGEGGSLVQVRIGSKQDTTQARKYASMDNPGWNQGVETYINQLAPKPYDVRVAEREAGTSTGTGTTAGTSTGTGTTAGTSTGTGTTAGTSTGTGTTAGTGSTQYGVSSSGISSETGALTFDVEGILNSFQQDAQAVKATSTSNYGETGFVPQQEALTKQDYTSKFVDFGSQYYGLKGLGNWTSIGVDPDDETDDADTDPAYRPSDAETGDGVDEGMDTLGSLIGGLDTPGLGAGVSFGLDAVDFDVAGMTYAESLASLGLTDLIGSFGMDILGPALSGNFDSISFKDAFGSTPDNLKDSAASIAKKESWSVDNIAKKGLGLAFSSMPMGFMIGGILNGQTVKNAFGHNSLRPGGLLGIIADAVHYIQFNDMAAMKAASQGISFSADFTGNINEYDTGFALDFGMGGITRAPGSRTYTGNMRGLSHGQVTALEAISKGYTYAGYNMNDGNGKVIGTTIASTGGLQIDPSNPFAGYISAKGNPINAFGQGSYYAYMDQVNALAKTYGVSSATIQTALNKARSKQGTFLENINAEIEASLSNITQSQLAGTYTPGTTAGFVGTPKGGAPGTGTYQSGITGWAGSGSYGNVTTGGAAFGPGTPGYSPSYDEDDLGTAPTTPSTPSAPAPSAPADDPYANESDYGGGGYDSSDNAADDDAGDTDSVGGGGWGGNEDDGGSYDDSFAKGGKVPAYAFGTPPAGVQASQSGFIDRPPSQVTDGAKVADDRPMKAKEGTYILNAAAVEFAGEKDIRKMIMDAQKEAVRRGLSTEDFERHSNLIDIAVSSGEVTIAPHLVKIIGEDRLEKINKRGIRKTEQRIAQNGQQPVQAARGGFLA
jgi:hypothetical protein